LKVLLLISFWVEVVLRLRHSPAEVECPIGA
jgi:hypothetical protein